MAGALGPCTRVLSVINARGWIVVALAATAILSLASHARGATARPSLPPPSLCDVARSILREARGDVRLAEMIARKRGHSDFEIAAAKRFCRRS